MHFTPGLQLCEDYFRQAIAPILKNRFSDVPYSAALMGYGSDVLGLDDATSMDHNWGPRVILFLAADSIKLKDQIFQVLKSDLPLSFNGFPTRLSSPHADGTRKLIEDPDGDPFIEIAEIDSYFSYFLGKSPCNLKDKDWLSIPEQVLLELTSGKVFYDGLNRLNHERNILKTYPSDIRKLRLAAFWQNISNEEPFLGRMSERNDLLGAKLIAGRLVNHGLKICFMLKQRYIPYAKWFSIMFETLNLDSIKEKAVHILNSSSAREIEEKTALFFKSILDLQNEQPDLPSIDLSVRNFHNRPYKVLMTEQIAETLLSSISDESVRRQDLTAVALDIKNDSDDFTDSDLLAKIPF